MCRRAGIIWRSEDNFYGVVGSGTKLGPSGFPMLLTTESSHFFQILSFFFFKMFVVGMYLFVQVQMGTYAHVYA